MASLPGYYFDERANRYFRIVQSGQAAAAPSSSNSNEQAAPAVMKYTNSGLRKMLREEQENDAAELENYSSPEIPSSLSAGVNSPPSASSWTRYLHQYRVDRRQGNRARWAGLENSLRRNLGISGMTPQQRHPLPPEWGEINMAVLCDTKGYLAVGQANGKVKALHMFPKGKLVTPQHASYLDLVNLETPISSMVMNKQGTLLVTSTGGRGVSSKFFVCNLRPDGPYRLQGTVIKPTSTIQTTAIWSSALHSTTKGHFALLGCVKQFLYLNLDETYYTSVMTDSDALAVELSSEESSGGKICVAGFRNASVALYDARELSDTTSPRPARSFLHGGPLTNLKFVNENMMLAAGLNNSLALYDLRYVDIEKDRAPLIEYKGYMNDFKLNTRLTVSPDKSHFAIAGGGNIIYFYDTWTGRAIQHPYINDAEWMLTGTQVVTGLTWAGSNSGIVVARKHHTDYVGWSHDWPGAALPDVA